MTDLNQQIAYAHSLPGQPPDKRQPLIRQRHR